MPRALIVGGGPAGLCAAIALRRAGVDVGVVEIEAALRPAGIGIGLQSAPLRALKSLGLFDAVVRIGRPHPAVILQRADGTEVAQIPNPNCNAPTDPPFVSMSRAALHEALLDAVRALDIPIRFGITLRSLHETDRCAHVTLSDDSAEDCDIVIGADGLHSSMRSMLLPQAPRPEFCGQVIWRMAARTPPGLERYTIMVSGPTRIGLVPLPGDELYLWMLDHTLPPERPPREQLLGLFRGRMERYGGFAPAVAAQAVDGAQLDYRALNWLLVPPPWHRGRVVLIGDAVHATTPHMAYGAGLAIEDAVVLGELVAAGVPPARLGERLAARRFERCRLVVENSLQLSRWEQQPGPPNPAAGALIAATLDRMAEPI